MIRPPIRSGFAARAGFILLVCLYALCAAVSLSHSLQAQETSRTSGSTGAVGSPAASSAKAKPTTTGAIKTNGAANSWAAETKRPESSTSAAAAPATSKTTNPNQFDDWVLACESGKNCALVQRLADQKGRKVIQFRAAKTPKAAYLEVSAPLGLSIPYGVSLALPDKTAIKMELAVCDNSGCRAVIPLTDENLAKLKTDGRIGVRFQDSRSGKVLTVYGSLKGFSSGVAKLLSAG